MGAVRAHRALQGRKHVLTLTQPLWARVFLIFFWKRLSANWQAAFFCGKISPSQALPRQLSRRESQAVKLVAKVLGIMRKFPAVLLPLPLRKDFPRSGGRCRAAMTERAHVVSPYFKVSNAVRNFPAMPKAPPFGGAGTPSGVTERVRSRPSRENAFGALRRARQTRNYK